MQWSCVGHEEQKAHLERLMERAILPHAILLAGPAGIGKRMIAEDIAAALVPTGYHLDRMTLAPERDEEGKFHIIPIEKMRAVKSWAALRPMGPHKVVIVDEADLLSGDSANTMLKMLEEPPAYAHFILVASRPHAVLPTIASRCFRMDFRTLDDAQMKQALGRMKMDDDDRALLAAVAGGRPGTALTLVQGKRLPHVAKSIAGLEKALKGGITERLLYAKEIADADDAPEVAAWWLAWTHAQLAARPQLAPVAAGLLELHDALADPVFNRRLALDRFLLSW